MQQPSIREGLIYGLGSALLSTIIAWGMGQMFNLAPSVLLVVLIFTATLAGWMGYRSRMSSKQ